MSKALRILVAPLNWGLGHATRCIPIIDQLIELGAEVMLASDGRALSLLEKEYPDLMTFELPGYNIRYHKQRMILNIARQLPKITKAIHLEKKVIKKLVKHANIDVIISDNRFGCRSKTTRNIFITHQINIAVPNRFLEKMTNQINNYFIQQFDECWIPDFKGAHSLAGKLSESNAGHLYIGPLSRFEFRESDKEYDLIAVLSGPEPQRSILEEKVISQLEKLEIKALIVQGKTEKLRQQDLSKNIRIVSYLTTHLLNEAILKSEILLARAGYSTIMDLVFLQKNAILIPTPGQTEQEYLADRLADQGVFYTQKQEELDIEKALIASVEFSGFSNLPNTGITLKEQLKIALNI